MAWFASEEKVSLDKDLLDIFTTFAAIDERPAKDWRMKIIAYLKNTSTNISGTIRNKATSYVLVDEELYKRSHEGLLLKYLRKAEALKAMAEVHEGLYDMH